MDRNTASARERLTCNQGTMRKSKCDLSAGWIRLGMAFIAVTIISTAPAVRTTTVPRRESPRRTCFNRSREKGSTSGACSHGGHALIFSETIFYPVPMK